MASDNHYYDMVEFNYQQANRLILRFRKSDQLLSQLDIIYHNMPVVVQAICSAYAQVTLGYPEALCCAFEYYSRDELLPMLQFKGKKPNEKKICFIKQHKKNPLHFTNYNLIIILEEIIAGGIIEAYEAQCCYFKVYLSKDISRLLEALYRKRSFNLDLTDCPLVEDPKTMLPLIGALRHNTYFLSLKLTECKGNQQILLMLANVLRFNSTITKIELSNLDHSPRSFEVFGSSLKSNPNHAIQVIDITNNKIPSIAMDSISGALSQFTHALQGLRLKNCQLSLKSLTYLFQSFKDNYGMSLAIQLLDLSQNHLGGRGSVLIGNWLNRIREDSQLEHLYLRNTSLAFVFIGRALVHYPNLRSLDLSENNLDIASVQLLTLWIETSMNLQSLNVSSCNINGEYIGKILSVMLSNRNLSQVHVHMDRNDLKKENDGNYIIEALKRGSNIHTLSLSRNKFKPVTFLGIIDALQRHHSLHTLVLDNCLKASKKQEKNLLLSSALSLLVNQNENIRALSISQSYELHFINNFFEKLNPNAKLEEIDVSRNHLKDLGASIITKSLRNNCNLKYLMIDNNYISYTGWQAILQIFSTNIVLEKIPFPWVDYHRLGIKQGVNEEQKVRKILTNIQKMCSFNFNSNNNDIHEFPDLKRYFLFSKSTICIDFDAPTCVSPLATVPEDIFDEDDPFTFADDSDDDQTVKELMNLKLQSSSTNAMKNSLSKQQKSNFSSSDEDEDVFLQDDFEDSDDDNFGKQSSLPPPPPSRGDFDLPPPPLPNRDDNNVSSISLDKKQSNNSFDLPPPLPDRDNENYDDDLVDNFDSSSDDDDLEQISIPPPTNTIPQRPSNAPSELMTENPSTPIFSKKVLPKPPVSNSLPPPPSLPPAPAPAPAPVLDKNVSNIKENETNDSPKQKRTRKSSKTKDKKTTKTKSSTTKTSKSKNNNSDTPTTSKLKEKEEKPIQEEEQLKQEQPKQEPDSKAKLEHHSLSAKAFQDSKEKLRRTKTKKSNKRSTVPAVKGYVFSDEEDSSDDDLTTQSFACDSIGDLLLRVMGERREFIEKSDEEDFDDYSSDDDFDF